MAQRFFIATFVVLGFTLGALAQSDRGTITGTVTDASGAVIPAASLVARNAETDARYSTVTTPTGNYTLPELPVGIYELTVTAPGFSSFIQQGIRVELAQTARVDVAMRVGASNETVTVTADAPLLKTESAEQSYNVNVETMNNEPLEFDNRLRNPYLFSNLGPGITIATSTSGTDDYRSDIRINGAPGSTYGVRVDGQNSDDSGNQATGERNLPAVETIQEFSAQTSNFAAEYGQVIGGLIIFTTRSGTNQYHGSAYDAIKNEALNAGIPFTNGGDNGQHTRPTARQENPGFSLGGPVRIPKLYDGHNKTFFFANYERFQQGGVYASSFEDVPTDAMRQGNFSAILTGRTLATDPLGRSILENTIYDPASDSTASNGQIVRTLFPGNIIPQSRFDPVAVKIQALFPQPTNSGLVNNFAIVYPNTRTFDTTNIKIDHNLGTKQHISGLWTFYRYDSYSHVVGDGLPDPISGRRLGYQRVNTVRLTDDYTVTPTLLLHLAVGEVHLYVPDAAPPAELNFNSTQQLGLIGAAGPGFPQITGTSGSLGGMVNFGVNNASIRWQDKPTAVTSATWVHGNHSYKIGGEWRDDAAYSLNVVGQAGAYTFSPTQTGLPSTNGQNLNGGTVGFAYASFLLGEVNTASIAEPSSPHFEKRSWGLFVQDTWKMTRKLTLDYGLRWDYLQGPNLENDRISEFSPTTPNPAAGGLLGATVYEGYGPGRCSCSFFSTYPFAIGPRLGVAYEITPKWVLRGGWGLVYGNTPALGQVTGRTDGIGWNTINFTNPSYGEPATTLQQGLVYNPASLTAVNYNPGFSPLPGQLNSPTGPMIDAGADRPPRVNQWNISLQHQITNNLLAEAAFVGNRGVWLQASGLVNLNAITPQMLAARGLNVNSSADQTLLASPLNSSLAISRGFGTPPYPGFPLTATVAQSLRPFPQFGTLTDADAPIGNSWYDALQAKLTQRFTKGFEAAAAFSWQGQEARGVETGTNDVFDRAINKYLSSMSQPFNLQVSFRYTIPALGSGRLVRMLTEGWTFSGIGRYASGLPILAPVASNDLSTILFQSTYENPLPGQPLFLVNPNCSCYDPNKQFVLNPAAWTQAPNGQFGTAAAYYNDYRWRHQYDEQAALGRSFRIREKMSLSIRVEFFNALNRTKLNAPTSTNAQATQTTSGGVPTSGFGYDNTTALFGQPRSGQIVGRFEF
jgi:hypothetical protein